MTTPVFRDDAYLTDCPATVTGLTDKGIILDRTVFYAQGGGQPGDVGQLVRQDGMVVPIVNTIYGEDRKSIVHVPADGAPTLSEGDTVTAILDWDKRYARMRIHTALHLLKIGRAHV